MNIHIGAAAAGLAFLFMLAIAAISEEGGNAWARLFTIVGSCVIIVGLFVALTAAERHRWIQHLARERAQDRAAVAQYAKANREALQQIGRDIEGIRRMVGNGAITMGQMAAWTEQVSAWAGYVGAELTRFRGGGPDPEGAMGGPAPASLTAVLERLGQVEQGLEQLVNAGLDAEVIELGNRISRKIQSGADG